MATADSVKAKLQGLIAKANETTGNTDADLTTAVNALVAGFGQGGGGTPFAIGSFTLTKQDNNIQITHNLNSNNVLVIWSVRDNPAIYTGRYKSVMGFAVSQSVFPARIVDVSSYHTAGLTETEFSPSTVYNSVDNYSAYASSTNTPGAGAYRSYTSDKDTFKLVSREGFLPGLTFDWIAIDIDGVTFPWA